MPGHRTRRPRTALLTAAVLAAALAVSACSGNGKTPSSVSSAASSAASAFASATAEAGRKFAEVKGGVDARKSVTLGKPMTGADGRTAVEVTAENTTDATKSFAVQIDFSDANGNRLDTAVITVSDVAAGGTGKATAHSNRKLNGQVKTKVARALRY
jgi:predicted small secreted protein